MLVKELIERLQKVDSNLEVMIDMPDAEFDRRPLTKTEVQEVEWRESPGEDVLAAYDCLILFAD